MGSKVQQGLTTPTGGINPEALMLMKAIGSAGQAQQGQLVDIGGGYQQRQSGNAGNAFAQSVLGSFAQQESERKKKLEKQADRKYAEEQKRVQNVLSNYKDQERNRFAAEQSQLTRDASAEQAALGRAERGRVADQNRTNKLEDWKNQYGARLGERQMDVAMETVRRQEEEAKNAEIQRQDFLRQASELGVGGIDSLSGGETTEELGQFVSAERGRQSRAGTQRKEQSELDKMVAKQSKETEVAKVDSIIDTLVVKEASLGGARADDDLVKSLAYHLADGIITEQAAMQVLAAHKKSKEAPADDTPRIKPTVTTPDYFKNFRKD